MYSLYWLIIFIVLVIIEAATMGLTTIWFAGGALVAFVLSLFMSNLGIQAAVFIAVSILLLVFTRPVAMRYLNRRTTRTNADSLIGCQARVTEAVDNRKEQGAARIGGKTWTARSCDDNVTFQENDQAVVREIRGVTLILDKEKEED